MEALLAPTSKNPRKRSVCEGFVLAPEEGFKPVAGDHSRFFRSGSAPCCRSGALAGRLPLGGPNPLILTQNETRPRRDLVSFWLRRRDLNPRPSD